MAQTVLPNESTGLVSGSFAAPPGLESGVSPSALAEEESRGPSGDRTSLDTTNEVVLEDVRRNILTDVDAKVSEKMKDFWSRGKQLLSQIEQENTDKTNEFIVELTRCREKQESLAAEQTQIRTALATVVQQLQMLGTFMGPGQGLPTAAVPAKAAPPTPPPAPGLSLDSTATANVSGSTVSTSPSCESSAVPASATPGLQDSPLETLTPPFSSGVLGATALPLLPDFPFPASTGSACPTPSPSLATPLSLAEALSSDLPATTTPLSLSNSLAQSPTELAPTTMFSFTLRKADNTDLGLNVTHQIGDKALRVEGVRPDGAVEAWNRQCISTCPQKAVLRGDRIIMVNAVYQDPVKMLEECRDRALLKLCIVRGDGPLPDAPGAAKTTTLRADASEFVPAGLAPETNTQKDEKPECNNEAEAVVA